MLPRRVLSLVTLSLASVACSPALDPKPPSIRDADDQLETCKIARDPLNPFIVEWPAVSKSQLEVAASRGAVVVSYAGCNLKLLPQCRAQGAYELVSTTPAVDVMEITNTSDLYAKLPLGAAALKGELSTGSSLALEYVAVGQRTLSGRPGELGGGCEGATHYVEAITVGAYALDARARAAVGGGVEVQQAGLGGEHREDVKHLKAQGDVRGCSAKPDASVCGAVLQLSLAPLGAGARAQVAVAQQPTAAPPPSQTPASTPPAQPSPAETSAAASQPNGAKCAELEAALARAEETFQNGDYDLARARTNAVRVASDASGDRSECMRRIHTRAALLREAILQK